MELHLPAILKSKWLKGSLKRQGPQKRDHTETKNPNSFFTRNQTKEQIIIKDSGDKATFKKGNILKYMQLFQTLEN